MAPAEVSSSEILNIFPVIARGHFWDKGTDVEAAMLVLFPQAVGSSTARVRVRMPLGLCWEVTKRVRVRLPGGRWVALVYLRRHIWTTCARWPKLDVDHVAYDVQQVGPFVLACRDIF